MSSEQEGHRVFPGADKSFQGIEEIDPTLIEVIILDAEEFPEIFGELEHQGATSARH